MAVLSYDFTGTNGTSLPSPWSTVANTCEIQGNAARLIKAASAWSVVETQHGSATHADLDVTARLIVRNISDSLYEHRYRSRNSFADEYRFILHVKADPADRFVTGSFSTIEAGVETNANLGLYNAGALAVVDTAFWYRLQVVGTTHQFKIWADGSGEPGSWSSSITNSLFSAAGVFTALYGDASTAAQYLDIDSLTLDNYLATPTRIAPDAILAATNLTGAVSVIQDDPDSPDANWLTAP